MTAAIWIPTSLLAIAAAMDLRFGKFPNWMFIATTIIGLIWLSLNTGIKEFMLSFAYSICFFIALAPLVYLKVFGAGDIKLLAAFSLFVTVPVAATVLVYSLFWGLLIGIIKIALAGDFKNFAQSFALRTNQVRSQRIPYVVAILLGWCSLLVTGDFL